jgi:hypothetical protein
MFILPGVIVVEARRAVPLPTSSRCDALTILIIGLGNDTDKYRWVYPTVKGLPRTGFSRNLSGI